MLSRILSAPLIVVLMGLGALAMFLPAINAAVLKDIADGQVFLQMGILFLILSAMLGIATAGRTISNPARSYLLALLAAFALLPIMLAVPFSIVIADTSFLNSYVEMVSDFTTTGVTLFPDPDRLPASAHLWRALVGWLGGLLTLITAVAILAPMNLGGYEVLSRSNLPGQNRKRTQAAFVRAGSIRLRRHTAQIFPVYAGLTIILWITLLMLGDAPLVAISHAMSVMATSGISPIGGLQEASSGLSGEIIILVMLIFAISRQTYNFGQNGIGLRRVYNDPELRLGLTIAGSVTILLFVRHWVGAYEVDTLDDSTAAFTAFWGGVFTVVSFLTTTGFESFGWSQTGQWSGLDTPGVVMLGLALIGGGVATTAGGIKLLRVYALYKHGVREMDRLVYPKSIGGSGTVARRLRRHGANVAWVFFMLFALSLAAITALFALTGLSFEAAVILSVAALSTTGPLVNIASETAIDVGSLTDAAKLILAAAMVLGRLETLAIIALFNPEFWRS